MTLPPVPDTTQLNWNNVGNVPSKQWTCGYCGSFVSSHSGYSSHENRSGGLANALYIYICPHCKLPTLRTYAEDWQSPSHPPGAFIEHVPDQLAKLYDEARAAAGANAHTAAVMVCRVLLMNIAVDRGAKRRETYDFYINYLFEGHYLSPDGKQVAEYVKRLGNDANHKIVIMDSDASGAVIRIIEALFRQIYETPNLIPDKIRNAPPVNDEGEEQSGT